MKRKSFVNILIVLLALFSLTRCKSWQRSKQSTKYRAPEWE